MTLGFAGLTILGLEILLLTSGESALLSSGWTVAMYMDRKIMNETDRPRRI